MLFREHRLRGYIIPRYEEITESKGSTSTIAVIKGKKYKGGMVVDPTPGVHFQVAVLDFASLYPSIIKTWNLGYETILCKHPEDRTNKIPGTDHWVCRKNRAMESQLVGSLRDVRIRWYKPRSKEKSLDPSTLSWYQVVQNALKVVLNASYAYSEAIGSLCIADRWPSRLLRLDDLTSQARYRRLNVWESKSSMATLIPSFLGPQTGQDWKI